MKLNSLHIKNFRLLALTAPGLRFSEVDQPQRCGQTLCSTALHQAARVALALVALSPSWAHADVPTRPAPAALPAAAPTAPPAAAPQPNQTAKAAPLKLPSAQDLARITAEHEKHAPATAAHAPGHSATHTAPASGKPGPAAPAPGVAQRPPQRARDGLTKKPVLPLAPSAAEIRREIATRDGGKASEDSASHGADGDKLGGTSKKRTVGGDLQQRATAPPKQDRRWPTTVDHHAGPTGPAGPGTAGERKGSVMDASGPQQGVIRNRW